MARWENENFNTQTPPETIWCATCKHKMEPVTVMGVTKERYTYSSCNKYDMKPHEILWDHALCPYYEREINGQS